MTSAKDIIVKPIARADADRIVKRLHYSHSVVRNSQLHLGVFLGGRCHGVMQFGPSFDKRKIQGIVSGTAWDGFLELNRLAFDDELPRNSESRALGVAMRMLRKNAPQVKWVISFADGTQCGDGTIYRAAGFVLTGIRRNQTVYVGPKGDVISAMTVSKHTTEHGGASSMQPYVAAGYKPMPGFQLRYLYFLDPSFRSRLTVKELPFSAIAEAGAKMYRGKTPLSACAALGGVSLPATPDVRLDPHAPTPTGTTT